MKKLLFGAALLCAALFSSCGDEYDDTALRNEMEGLKDRIAALEEKLTQEVNTLKGLIAAAEKGLAVGVEETTEGYEVTIGDETFTINHGKDGENGTDGTDGADGTVITVVEVDGVYYWAINGEATEYPVTGNDGEDGEDGEDGAPGQNGYTPEIKDGKWYINGEEVGPAVGENGKDGDSFFKNVTVNEDDTVTFTLANDTTITVALAKSAKYADVQSIKFVPEYSDGKLTVSYYTGAEDAFVVAKYEVTPKAAAATIAKYAKDASMQAVYTKTRAEAGEVVVLPVTAIEAEEGVITVTATATELAAEFFAGSLEASVRFAVQDDLSGNASEYVAAVAEKVEMPEFTATAVAEGYQGAKLTWTEIPAAAYYQIKSGDVVVAEKVEGTEALVENLTAANNYAFTVAACTANGAELVSGATAEIQIYSLTNRPEPVITLADGVLTVANAAINESATKVDNLHIYGALLEAEIYFYKDGATEPSHTAVGSYLDSYPGTNLPLSYSEKKLKNNIAGAYTAWKWDGAAEATKTVPEFEAGVWTVKYKAGYHTFVNAAYGSDRLVFSAPTDALQTMVYREADSDLTFTVEKTWNVTASIDNGTDEIRKLFAGWVDSWTSYGWYGKRSVNGQLETVTLTWDEIEADKVVVEYLGETVEVTTGLPFHIITGLKTSPVEFTVTAYQGETALANAKVTSDVYTLPEAAAGTFNATYSAENGGWTITGVGFNTTQYATWNCSFNLYEKGSETPVFETPITKHSQNDVASYLGWISNYRVGVSHNAFNVGDGNWDQGKLFSGLKGETEYEVRFELGVFPYIYDAENANNNEDNMYYKKMLMGSERTEAFGAMKLAGTTTFTTGEGPAAFEAIAAAEGYQGAKVTWIAADGATGYEVYVGETKVAEAGADATEVVITGLTDARKYTFNVKALGTDLTAETPEVDIYTLFDYAPEFDIVKQDDGSWKFNMYKLAYAGGIFRSIAFTLKEKGSDEVLYSENGTPGETGFIADGSHWGWTGARATNWVNQTDTAWSTAEGKKLAGIEFKYNTTYVIEYTATLNPGIAAWTAAEYTGSWTYNAENMQAGKNFFFKSMLVKSQAENANIPLATTTGTMEFTTEAPAPTFDLVGNYTKEYFALDVDAKSGNTWTDGTYGSNPMSFTAVTASTEEGPKWITNYNKYGLTLYFDVDGTELAGKPGCYALTNFMDRGPSNQWKDKIVDHGSYYDSTTGQIVFKIVIESSSAPGGYNGGSLEDNGVTVPGWAIGVTMTPAAE